MTRRNKIKPAVMLLTVLASLTAHILQPSAPALAWMPQTWNTQAAFNAGVLNNVDTSSSPNNVLLAVSLDNFFSPTIV